MIEGAGLVHAVQGELDRFIHRLVAGGCAVGPVAVEQLRELEVLGLQIGASRIGGLGQGRDGGERASGRAAGESGF